MKKNGGMEIEQLEIRDYVAKCEPFDQLSSAELDAVVREMEISYMRAGGVLLEIGKTNNWLYLIRKGALDVYDHEGSLHNRITSGEWVGYRSVFGDGRITMRVGVIEDALLYMVPRAVIHRLIASHQGIADYFHDRKNQRLRKAIEASRGSSDANSLVATHVRDLLYNKPLLIDSKMSIRDAAKRMSEKSATAMLVTDNDRLAGIVTERAFCTEVAAKGTPLDRPIGDIMTSGLITIGADTLGSDALLTMARHHVRHLPVMERGEVVGMITATDLIRRQSHNTLYIINQIHRAENVGELASLSKQLPMMLVNLVSSSLTAYDTARAISSVGEAITQRIIKLAKSELGEPPVPFAWIAAGSLARFEQTVHSDQDNGIILSDDYDAEAHGEYFRSLAKYVSDGLNACGYVYCPGNVMATNDEWRQPLAVWRRYFNSWISTPEKKALMYVSIFFDLRCLCGDASLLERLNEEVLAMSRGNSIFLAFMAANALQYRPPLGFFRNFVLEKGGGEEAALDMKKRGVTPIVDLARVYALEAGLTEINTRDRLLAAAAAGALSESGMEDMRDAYEFISTTRLQHQMQQIRGNKAPDNYVPPNELSTLERRHLKDAFDVVRTLQASIEQRYRTERLT